MPTLRNGSKVGFNPGSLDCESGILPLSYSAPQSMEEIQEYSRTNGSNESDGKKYKGEGGRQAYEKMIGQDEG